MEARFRTWMVQIEYWTSLERSVEQVDAHHIMEDHSCCLKECWIQGVEERQRSMRGEAKFQPCLLSSLAQGGRQYLRGKQRQH